MTTPNPPLTPPATPFKTPKTDFCLIDGSWDLNQLVQTSISLELENQELKSQLNKLHSKLSSAKKDAILEFTQNVKAWIENQKQILEKDVS